MRLLIVEDEKELCDTISKSLYGSGYEVDTCYDGHEALDYILTEDYDLIVLDLNLPGMDGMDILRELRKENEETKVLILSARSQIIDKVEGLDAGANDYMEKPFHIQELEARIRSLTRRKFVQKDKNYMQDTFCEQVCTYIKQLQRKEQEKARKLGKTSYRMLTGEKNVTVVDYTQEEEVSLNGSNMLVGMEQEVGLILSAIHMGV